MYGLWYINTFINMENKINFETEFHQNFKSGYNISVMLPKYHNVTNVHQDYIVKNYLIGRTDLNDSHGQVELTSGNRTMIVEYQWFSEKLTGRKIIIL